MEIVSPLMAILDGVETDIESSMESSGGSVDLTWKFPHFSNTLEYDPSVSENAGNIANDNHLKPIHSESDDMICCACTRRWNRPQRDRERRFG